MNKRIKHKYYPMLQSLNDDKVDTKVTQAGVRYCWKLLRGPRGIAIPMQGDMQTWFEHFEDQAHQDYRATYLNPNWHVKARTVSNLTYRKGHLKDAKK